MAWSIPETRASILLRVSDPQDHEAWEVFESIYRQAIFRAARASGLQDADADDIAQIVLAGLAGREWQFKPDVDGARFRTWLAKVVRNAIIDHCRSRRRHGQLDPIREESAVYRDPFDEHLELEYRREVFLRAARIIRCEFSSSAWQCFWMTAVENRTVAEVSQELNRSVGSIYTNRSRIMRRLKDQVRRFDDALDGEL